MEKYSEVDPAVRSQQVGHIDRRWGQLYGLQKEWGERAFRYLLLTNAGGAIATLSFLGTSKLAITMPSVKLALILFIAGVVFVGFSIAKQFHHMTRLFKAWKKDVNRYFGDSISWKHLNNADVERAVEDAWDYIFPYAAFACFVSGCVLGGIALFNHA